MTQSIMQKLEILNGATKKLTTNGDVRCYKDHFDNNHLPMVWADQHGGVINCNLAMVRLLGRPRDKIVGQPISSYATPADEIIKELTGDGLSECHDFQVKISTSTPEGTVNCRLYSNIHRDKDGNWINSRCVLVPCSCYASGTCTPPTRPD